MFTVPDLKVRHDSEVIRIARTLPDAEQRSVYKIGTVKRRNDSVRICHAAVVVHMNSEDRTGPDTVDQCLYIA